MEKVLTINGHKLEIGIPKYMTKHYSRFLDSADTTLKDVYTTWSAEKEYAYKNCKRLFDDLKGSCFTIVAKNGWMFTVGFWFKYENETYFCYITPNHKRICKVNDITKLWW